MEQSTLTQETTAKKTTIIKAIVGLVITVILVILDQVTKMLAVTYLKGKDAFVLIDGVFELRYLENRGAAFGIMQGKQWFFIVFTCVLFFIIAYFYLFRIPNEKRFRFLNAICVLLFAGAIGNFIDRVMNNYVVDFFYFSLIDFPIFNVADIYATCAAIALIVLGIFYYKDEDYEVIFPSKKKEK